MSKWAAERKKYQFYVDRSGRVYKFKGNCEEFTSVHYEIAKKIYPDLEFPEDKLMNEGWILCGSSVYNSPIIHQKPSQAQLDKLFDLGLLDRLCFLHNGSYPNYMKYRALIDN